MGVNFQPTGDFVLVEVQPKGFSAGGLALPEGADMGPDRGLIVAVGPGRHTEYGVFMEQEYSVGDMVYVLGNQPVVPVTLGGKEYLVMNPRTIVGRVPTAE